MKPNNPNHKGAARKTDYSDRPDTLAARVLVRHKWTQAMLAEHLGTSTKTVECWVAGRKPSTYYRLALERLASARDVKQFSS